MNFKKTVAIAAAAGALSALALPAMAETTLYGSVRAATMWSTVDTKTTTAAAGTKSDSNTDFDLRLQNNTRLGAKFSDSKLAGQFELGFGPQTTPGVTTALRLAYGTYKFDFGSLKVGQDYTPYWLGSAQIAMDDNGFHGYGDLYDGRLPQIKLTLDNGLYVAAIKGGVAAGNVAVKGYTGYDATPATEVFLPKLSVGYEGKAGNFAYGAGVLGQIYHDVATTDKQVTSFLGYVHGVVVAGPADVTFNLGAGQNLGDMGFGTTAGHASAVLVNNTTGKSVKNTTSFEGFVQGGFRFDPMAKVNVAVGYAQDSNDTWKPGTAATSTFKKIDNRVAVIVNAPLTIAKNFTITPEFDYLNELDNANSANNKGNVSYIYGAQFRMDF